MKNVLIIIVLLTAKIGSAQNLILNPDFELYSNCPTNLGDIDSAVSWVQVVQSADYYNCGLSTTSSYPSNSTAFSGTGFIGFASYGDPNGSSEAVGQHLLQPLLPGQSYAFSFAAKKPYSGTWSTTCGGVALYGFESNMPLNQISVHLAQSSNSQLLGTSSAVQDTAWQLFSFVFTPSDTVNSIAMTVEHSPNCTECIFLDAVHLDASKTAIAESSNEADVNVFPNPCSDQLTFSAEDNQPITLFLYDLFGQEILRLTFENAATINTAQLADGVYFYELHNDTWGIKNGKIVKQ